MYIAAAGSDDVKSKAVNEMMERIKHGVVLRPVKSKDSKVSGGHLRFRLHSVLVHRL